MAAVTSLPSENTVASPVLNMILLMGVSNHKKSQYPRSPIVMQLGCIAYPSEPAIATATIHCDLTLQD
jgi:hypothetical protein